MVFSARRDIGPAGTDSHTAEITYMNDVRDSQPQQSDPQQTVNDLRLIGSQQKTILFAWELGRGLGHALQILPLAEELGRRGHRVYAAMRYLNAAPLLTQVGVTCLAAPQRPPGPEPYPTTLSYAQLLSNVGWADAWTLSALAGSWRSLIELVRPDMIIFDHSPTALLASQGLQVRRALIGTGFFCPPDTFPLPLFARNNVPVDLAARCTDERQVLAHVNALLRSWGLYPLARLAALYTGVDENFLTTFPELDHFPRRAATQKYWGPVNGTGGGKAVAWPSGQGAGRRVYAYLKQFPALPELLEALTHRGLATVVFADRIDPAVRRRFESATLHFEDERLNLAQVGRECDLAIHNGNHGTLTELLLSGRPMLQLPITMEQAILARAVERAGAAETVPAGTPKPGEIAHKLDKVLFDPRYGQAARNFARHHAGFNPKLQRRRMRRRVDELLGVAPPQESDVSEEADRSVMLTYPAAIAPKLANTELPSPA